MLRIKSMLTISALLLMIACIEPFKPDIDSNAENKYVVSGRITDQEGWQEVSISLSSPLENPAYAPLSGCQVTIMDDRGGEYQLEEYSTGNYHAWFGQESLVHGFAYMVTVLLPSGEMIESTFERLMPCPPIDSVYFILEDRPTSEPGLTINGVQFYIDLEAENYETRNFKWEIDQTYEYHAAQPVRYFYNGSFNKVDPPDFSNVVCWRSSFINQVFTISTKTLARNAFTMYPLHFIDGRNPRLGILYSMLISQYALSDAAFDYWDRVRVNSHELGGLYEKQPFAIKGNLVNVTNPEKEVLGYFYAASVNPKRYFYREIEGLELDFPNNCLESELGILGWSEFSPEDYPVYYYYSSAGLRILSDACIDCRLLGGTTSKPGFWP